VNTLRRQFRASIVAPLLAAVLAVSVAAIASSWSTRGQVPHGEAPRDLVLRGKVHGLYPGHAKTLRVRVHNPLAVRVGVYRVSARARRANTVLGRCPGRVVRIKPWKGMVFVPAGTTRQIRLRIRLARRTPDRCQGARWHVTYNAKSVRV
jgi:tetrahydromethanopterin S-methyltransferase subunit E